MVVLTLTIRQWMPVLRTIAISFPKTAYVPSTLIKHLAASSSCWQGSPACSMCGALHHMLAARIHDGPAGRLLLQVRRIFSSLFRQRMWRQFLFQAPGYDCDRIGKQPNERGSLLEFQRRVEGAFRHQLGRSSRACLAGPDNHRQNLRFRSNEPGTHRYLRVELPHQLEGQGLTIGLRPFRPATVC